MNALQLFHKMLKALYILLVNLLTLHYSLFHIEINYLNIMIICSDLMVLEDGNGPS